LEAGKTPRTRESTTETAFEEFAGYFAQVYGSKIRKAA